MSLTNAFRVQDQIVLGQLQVGTTTFSPSAYVYTLSARDVVDCAGDVLVGGELRGPGPEFIIRSGDSISNTVRIAGNLQVDGSTTIINSTELTVDDRNITLASGATGLADVDGAGLTVDLVGARLYYDPYYNNNVGRWVVDRDLLANSIAVTGQSQFSVIDTSVGSNTTRQQTFSGVLSSTGFPIDTFEAIDQSVQFAVHAIDGTITSSSQVLLSINGTSIDGTIYGDTTTSPNGHHLITDIDADISNGYLRLIVTGSAGDVTVFGTSQTS